MLGEEIELRQHGAAGFQQLLQALLEGIQIHGGDVFVILGAVRQTGILFQILEEIIHADHLGLAAPGPDGLGQLVGRGGLARRRRTGHHHDASAQMEDLSGGGVDPAFVFVFAMGDKLFARLGGSVDQTDLNQSFGNPHGWHKNRLLLPCA